MGDEGELWNAVRKARQEKRASNRDSSSKRLTKEGIAFEPKNGGAHLIVTNEGKGLIDFWPGTGLWISRYNDPIQMKGRGVQNLINHIRHKTP